MSFLLHRDTCMAWVRRVALVRNRFPQHQGQLHVSAVTLMGLVLWLLHRSTPLRYQQGYMSLLQQVKILNLDQAAAERAGFLGTGLSLQNPRLTPVDLMVVGTAVEQGLTLVTHDVQHYAHVPGLALVDWLIP
jgi:tRNA(fMet)-specific endonuclease VapC